LSIKKRNLFIDPGYQFWVPASCLVDFLPEGCVCLTFLGVILMRFSAWLLPGLRLRILISRRDIEVFASWAVSAPHGRSSFLCDRDVLYLNVIDSIDVIEKSAQQDEDDTISTEEHLADESILVDALCIALAFLCPHFLDVL